MPCTFYNKDLTIKESATFDREFYWIQGENPGVRNQLSNVTGLMEIRKKMTDADPLLTIPSATSGWVKDGDTGIYILDAGTDQSRWKIYIKDDDLKGICALHKQINGIYTLLLYQDGETIFDQSGAAILVPSGIR